MGDKDLNSYDVLLMLNRETGALFPFSSHGFQFAQGSLRAMVRRNTHDMFLDSQGRVWRIADIRPTSDGVIAKLKRTSGLPYEIEVKTVRQSIELVAIKNLILKGMREFAAKLDGDKSWKFAALPYVEIEASISTAEDTKALYRVIALPDAEDCLDLL